MGASDVVYVEKRTYLAALPAYRAPLGGQSVGRHPLVTCFLQRLRPPARELFHSLESSALPFPGDQDSLLRDADPAHFNHLWPFFFRPSYAPSTLGRDLLVWWCGHLVALASSDADPVPKEECLRLRKSTQFLETLRNETLRNETLRLDATLPASLPVLASFQKPTAVSPQVLLCFLAIMSPAHDVSPILWTD